MDTKELIEELKKLCDNSIDRFAYMDYDTNDVTGKVEEVVNYGGEDMGSNWYSVQYFPKHDIYLRVNGYYSSYMGAEFDGWDDVVQVTPKIKTITVFE